MITEQLKEIKERRDRLKSQTARDENLGENRFYADSHFVDKCLTEDIPSLIDAIEDLQKKLDVAIDDLRENLSCCCCIYENYSVAFQCERLAKNRNCYFEWRGVPEVAK